MSDSVDRVALRVLAGSPLVLQRVPRAFDPDAFASDLAAKVGQAVRVVSALDDRPDLALVDLRHTGPSTFVNWDPRRADLVPDGGQRVVLLSAATGRALLQQAPHTASWAGDVGLPAEPSVRSARSDDELATGRHLFAAWAAEEALPRGAAIGIDLATERRFRGRADVSPLDLAREALDEGIVYLTRAP